MNQFYIFNYTRIVSEEDFVQIQPLCLAAMKEDEQKEQRNEIEN